MNIDENNLNDFLENGEEEKKEKKVVKSDKSIIERIDKTIIVEGGKQLLI